MCRKKLYDMRVVDSPLCLDCSGVDDLPHFLVHCGYVKDFWLSLISWLNSNLNYSLAFNEQDILFGINDTNDRIFVANFVILHAKYFIYKLRIQNIHTLQLVSFKSLLKYKLTVEKMITELKTPQMFMKFLPLYNALH